MHKERAGFCHAHHARVHAPVGKGLAAFFIFRFIAHAGPHVGGDQIGAFARLHGVVKIFPAAATAVQLRQRGVDFIAARGRYAQFKTQQRGGLRPGVGHIVAVANPGDGFALDGATVLDEGENVGQNLARVIFIRQTIYHGHARMFGKGFDARLLEGANHHNIHHAADDARGVFNRLAAPELAVARGQVHDAAAKLVHARLKTHARARAGFFKNHRQRAVGERMVFFIRLELALDDGGALQKVGVFIR